LKCERDLPIFKIKGNIDGTRLFDPVFEWMALCRRMFLGETRPRGSLTGHAVSLQRI
jgi:hypothetical protein